MPTRSQGLRLPSPMGLEMTRELDIKGLRTRLGYTQEELAWLVGVTRSTVHRWEDGRCQPSRSSLERLERVLKRGLLKTTLL